MQDYEEETEIKVEPMLQRIEGAVIIVLRRDEVLVVEHGEASGFEKGKHTFPCGTFDSEIDGDSRATAERELFEEAGLEAERKYIGFFNEYKDLNVQMKNGIALAHVKVYVCERFEKEIVSMLPETNAFWVKIADYVERRAGLNEPYVSWPYDRDVNKYLRMKLEHFEDRKRKREVEQSTKTDKYVYGNLNIVR